MDDKAPFLVRKLFKVHAWVKHANIPGLGYRLSKHSGCVTDFRMSPQSEGCTEKYLQKEYGDARSAVCTATVFSPYICHE